MGAAPGIPSIAIPSIAMGQTENALVDLVAITVRDVWRSPFASERP
jgi:hypothetical protein